MILQYGKRMDTISSGLLATEEREGRTGIFWDLVIHVAGLFAGKESMIK